jgi:hypothetical protein
LVGKISTWLNENRHAIKLSKIVKTKKQKYNPAKGDLGNQPKDVANLEPFREVSKVQTPAYQQGISIFVPSGP